MIRAVCEKCGALQPSGWKAGESCTSCGAAVRRDVRCAWCVKWTPAGKYCRGCGCELVPDARFGAGRMLKEAGVDRLSLAKRLGEMDPEQVDNFQRIYEEQRAIVNRRVEEAALCESFLLSRGFAAELEDELIESIPAEEGVLEGMAGGPKGPFAGSPELLESIADESPMYGTRALAAIALVRRGDRTKERLAAVRSAAHAGDRAGLEAALALANWRIARPESARGQDLLPFARRASAVLDEKTWRPWAAVAIGNVRVWLGGAGGREDMLRRQYEEQLDGVELGEPLDRALEEALDATDPDVRFAAAMALKRTDRLTEAARDGDPEMREVANALLARGGAPDSARALHEGSDDDRLTVMENLREPVPAAMVEPLLAAVEKGNERIREKGAWILARSHEKSPGLLDDAAVDRLLAVAERTGHSDILKALLLGDTVPGVDRIARMAFRTELHRGSYLLDSLRRAASEKRLAPSVLIELLEETGQGAGQGGAAEARAIAMLPVIESALGATGNRPLLKKVTRMFIGPGSTKLVHDACWVLRRTQKNGDQEIPKPTVSRAAVDEHFGSGAAFLADFTALLENHDALLEVGVYDSLADMLAYDVDPGVFPLLWEHAPAYRRFLEAILALPKNDKLWSTLRGNAIQFLEKAADHPDHREWVAAEVEKLGNPGDYWTHRVLCTLRNLPRD